MFLFLGGLLEVIAVYYLTRNILVTFMLLAAIMSFLVVRQRERSLMQYTVNLENKLRHAERSIQALQRTNRELFAQRNQAVYTGSTTRRTVNAEIVKKDDGVTIELRNS